MPTDKYILIHLLTVKTYSWLSTHAGVGSTLDVHPAVDAAEGRGHGHDLQHVHGDGLEVHGLQVAVSRWAGDSSCQIPYFLQQKVIINNAIRNHYE